MLSYVYLGTNDLARAIRFYDAVLGPLQMHRCLTGDPEWDRVAAGWGIYEQGGGQELALWVGIPFNQQPANVGNGTMVAMRARTRDQVDRFHAAALAQGGFSEGAPGPRPHYGPDFYAAYVRDPDGNKIAAVCHGTLTATQRQARREIIRVEPISTYLEQWKAPVSVVTCHGSTVYVSGLPPFDPATGQVIDAPIERQAEIVLEQLKRCLEAAGSSLGQVLKCNVYCTSVEKFAAFNAIYARYFPNDPPARIFVSVPAWPGKFDIEIDCIAYRE